MDKKYSFACVTVRNYNRNLDKLLSETFKKTQNQFANSKSQFLLYLAELGLTVYLKKSQKGGQSDSSNGCNELLDLVNELIEYNKLEGEVNKVHFKVSELIGSAILGILGDIADGKEIDVEDIERGMYDKVPERFLRILKQNMAGN